MKRSVLSVTIGTLFFLVATFGCTAQAAPRTFVSAQQGSDASSCTLNQPCRQFTKAIAEVDGGGQVIALDSGSYAPFSINKSVSILAAPGALVSIVAGGGLSSTVAININPIVVGVEVVLRGLTLKGGANGETGIIANGTVLHVENCQIDGFSQAGIAMTSNGQLFVKDSVVRNIQPGKGIDVGGLSSGRARVAIDHCRFENNERGVSVTQFSQATISHSLFAGNGIAVYASVDAFGRVFGPCDVTVENCVLTNGGIGIQLASFSAPITPSVWLSNSTITNNSQYGVIPTLFSRGNNTIEGNAVNTVGPLTLFAAK